MTQSRYAHRQLFMNTDKGYQKEFFVPRDVNQILQYRTGRISYPTNAQMEGMEMQSKVWGATSTLHKVAYDAYGSPEYWWVIGWFNKKPTEAHFSVGDVYYIPRPLEKALSFFEG